jgi:acetyl esterase/lipase
VVYASAAVEGGTIDLLLDVYQSGEECGDLRPFVITVHGGGFNSGSKTSPRWQPVWDGLTERDMVAISIDYRITEDIPIPADETLTLRDLILEYYEINTPPSADGLNLVNTIATSTEDIISAINWAQTNADDLCIDPDRYALWGGSAGAFAGLLTTYARDDAGLDNAEPDVMMDYWGGLPVTDALDSGEPPFFILHGKEDGTVDYSYALDLEEGAIANGIDYAFYTFDGPGHGLFSYLETTSVDGETLLEISLDFLEAHVRDGTPVYRNVTVQPNSNTTTMSASYTLVDFENEGAVSGTALSLTDQTLASDIANTGGLASVSSIISLNSQNALAVSFDPNNASTLNWQWPTLEPFEELHLSYKIRFENGFDFADGGFLPGLSGGQFDLAPSGTDGWATHLVWQSDGIITQHIAHPNQASFEGDHENWSDVSGAIQLETGRWYTVQQRVVMNDLGSINGRIEGWIDGTPALFRDGLSFRNTSNLAIDRASFKVGYNHDATGSGTILFDDVIVSASPISTE